MSDEESDGEEKYVHRVLKSGVVGGIEAQCSFLIANTVAKSVLVDIASRFMDKGEAEEIFDEDPAKLSALIRENGKPD